MTTGRLEYKKVLTLARPHPDMVVELHFAGEEHSLDPTPSHEFFAKIASSGAGVWVPASKLRTGDLVMSVKNTWLPILQISTSLHEETVYNF